MIGNKKGEYYKYILMRLVWGGNVKQRERERVLLYIDVISKDNKGEREKKN